MKKRKQVLLLGATGRIGPSLIEEYLNEHQEDYEIIIGIHKNGEHYGLKTRKFHLKDIPSLKRAMIGMDVVVNLAAQSNPEASFEEVLEPNIIGAQNVFEAAVQAKVERVIFASSVHAIRGYKLGEKVRHNHIPKPTGFYGASKVWGESLCYIYSENQNLSCLAIRLGAYVSNDLKQKVCLERENFDYMISQRDLLQLIHKCIIAPKELRYAILAGVSNNHNKYMDLKYTMKTVGYKPKDDVYKMCQGCVKKKRGFFWKRK